MSLLPIIYTSVLIFCGVVSTVLLVSYIIYKAKGGGPKPAAVQAVRTVNHSQLRNRKMNQVPVSNNYTHRNYKTTRNQDDLMFYKKPVSVQLTQPVRRKPAAPRVQVINKPVEKRIVVVRKSANYHSYNANNFLGYYNENEKGVLIQA